MADKDTKLPDNAAGAFYVDENCSDSGICREIAPQIFGHSKSAGYTFVARQPETEEERALCRKAKDGCPMAAIGDDGE
jgi:ferredoxin